MISSIENRKRKQAANQYTDGDDSERMWRVVLKCTVFPDRYMELWTDLEAQALAVPRGRIGLSQLFDILEPTNATMTVKSVDQSRLVIGKNQYTDKPQFSDAWGVSFAAEGLSAPRWGFANLWYPNKGEAYQFAIGRAYGIPDLLRVFRVLISFYGEGDPVTFYPAATYGSYSGPAFVDKNGFHLAGNYPPGFYPAGYVIADIKLFDISGSQVGTQGILVGSNEQYFLIRVSSGELKKVDF